MVRGVANLLTELGPFYAIRTDMKFVIGDEPAERYCMQEKSTWALGSIMGQQ